MNYWLHRISHMQAVSYPLLEKGYLSIGFKDFLQRPEFLKRKIKLYGETIIELDITFGVSCANLRSATG